MKVCQHCGQPAVPVQVVEVRCAGRAVRPEVRNRHKPAHCQSGLPRARESGVIWRFAVVVGAHDDAGLRLPLPNGPRHGCKVAGVKGHGHRMAGGLMKARPCRKPLDDADDFGRCDALFGARVVAP